MVSSISLTPVFSSRFKPPVTFRMRNKNWHINMIERYNNISSTTNPMDKFIQLIFVLAEEKNPTDEFHIVLIPINKLEKKPYSEK